MPTGYGKSLPIKFKSGKTLTVQVPKDVSDEDVRKQAIQAAETMKIAVNWIQWTILILTKKMYPETTRKVLSQCFQVKPEMTEALRLFAVGKLENILNGLNLDVHLKIGDLGEKTSGYVNHYVEKEVDKPYHTKAEVNGQDRVYGAIHLNATKIRVQTLVHEASHKFIQTSDYFQLVQVEGKNFEFTVHPLAKDYDKDDITQGSDNADSYGWLVWCLGNLMKAQIAALPQSENTK
jgi:hypothetical protein